MNERGGSVDWRSTAFAVAANRDRHDHQVTAAVDELHRLDHEIPPSLGEVPIPLPHAVPSHIVGAVRHLRVVLDHTVLCEVAEHAVDAVVGVLLRGATGELDVVVLREP